MFDDTINGDRFSDMCTFHWNDRHVRLNGLENESGYVFCKTDYLPELFERIRNVNQKYILITHNSDHNIDEERYSWKTDNVIHWFAQNVVISRNDLTPIPIGLERPGVGGSGDVKNFLSVSQQKIPQQAKAYANFASGTNLTREPLKSRLRNTSWCSVIEDRVPFTQYLQQLCAHKWIISPPGNGSDCHRTWEALCMGKIPVCKDTVHNQFFSKIFPMILYSDESEITEDFLFTKTEKLKKLYHRYDSDTINFEWWSGFIGFVRRQLLL